MLSFEPIYHVDLTNSKLPLKDIVLGHVSIVESDYDNFILNLNGLIPTAQVLAVTKTVLTPPGGVSREFEWLDIEIYFPKMEINRSYVGLGSFPELLSQAVVGVHPVIALIEVVGLTDDTTPIYYRREIGDLSILPFPADYKFVFKGVADLKRKPEDAILMYRAYAGEKWFVNGIMDSNLTEDTACVRTAKTPILVLAMHLSGMWVTGASVAEAAAIANMPALNLPSTTLNGIVANLWKLNPELQEHEDYQVYHRALHAYKIAFDKVPPETVLSILTHPDQYRGLAEFLITAPNPPAPNLRTYIAEHVLMAEGRFGLTDKQL